MNALQLSEKYGKPWEDQDRFQQEHMTLWQAPVWTRKYMTVFDNGWAPGTVSLSNPLGFGVAPFSRIYCNRAILSKLDITFLALTHMGLIQEIKTFDGCFNVRKIRGREQDPDAYSIHSFGLALDFNAADMPLGAPCKWTPKFLAVWKSLGWTNGGEFERRDFMHFECTEA
jgi:hypothetical protein